MVSSVRGIGLTVLIWAVATACQPAAAQSPEVFELVIHPARAPVPPLEYRLVPPLYDQAPGVAAPLYAQAFVALQERKVDDATWKKMQDAWVNGPLDEMPKAEVAEALDQVDAVMRCVELAARRSRFGMELALEDYEQLVATLWTQGQAFRTLARLVRLRVRYETLEGDFDEAVHWVGVGYAMARHCAEQPTALNALFGIALVGIMDHTLLSVIQLPEAPNLYWALTARPDPMIELQPKFDFESSLLELTFPEYGRAKGAGATPEQWRAILVQVASSSRWQRASEGSSADEPTVKSPSNLDALDVDAILKKALPVARHVLQTHGHTEAELDAMSAEETAVRALFEGFRSHCEEIAKWSHLPYWQAKPGIEASVQGTRRLLERIDLPRQGGPTLPAFNLQHVPLAAARNERFLAGLRCVEAIRLYAATHGKLPQKLEDITEVPLPMNPFTGELFTYRAEERYVILDLDGSFFNRQWWIRLADPNDVRDAGSK